MRSIHRLGTAMVALVALPLALSAQAGAADAIFRNAWYWGASGGQITFPTSQARTTAPEIGIDWLVTRTRWGAQFFMSQSYFNAQGTLADPSTTALRRVDMQDMRRVGFTATAFTPRLGPIRPYGGAGLSFNFIKLATLPQNAAFASQAQRDSVLNAIEAAKSRVKLHGTAGVMMQWRRFAPFAQGTVMPTRGAGRWLVNGQGFTWAWSAGLRYTFSGAIERF